VIQPPKALALFLCDQVIFERGTDKPSLIGLFDTLRLPAVPGLAPRFDVYAALTDGLGTITVDLVVLSLDDEERQVYGLSAEVQFPSPLFVVHLRLRLAAWQVLAEGAYALSLLVNGEELAQRRLQVRLVEE
jgi:hypothetical protein